MRQLKPTKNRQFTCNHRIMRRRRLENREDILAAYAALNDNQPTLSLEEVMQGLGLV